mgnify:CR=1 FL=1
MGGTITVLKWGIRNWYDEMIMFTGAGFLAALASLPFVVLLGLGFVVLQLPVIFLFVFAPLLPSPALVGMYGLARELAKGEGINWSLFWQVTRRYWLPSLALYGISLAGTLLIMSSMLFYLGSDNAVLNWIGYAWLYGIIIWLMVQMYLLPLLLEQERGTIFRVYRNALIIAAAKPILTIFILIVSVILLVAGYFTVIGLPLVVLPIIVCLGGHAVRFAVFGKPKTPAEEEAERLRQQSHNRR